MLVFYKDKVLLKGLTYDFDYEYLDCHKGFVINKSSRDLPDNWQNLTSWADVKLEGDSLCSGEKFITMRELLHMGDDALMKIASKAWQFRNWFMNVNFCSHCGGQIVPSEHDYGRICERCGATFYAPISPAVITAIEKDGKLLLAHNVAWPETRYSIIAGFVEPGERLEETVRREIREEVSIEVKNVKYFGSQTWPFPNSLMLGFTAEYESGKLKPDGVEISDAGYFTPEEIRGMNIPDKASIARKLIENFLATH